jgi:pilus assembly protein CpaB
MSSGLRLSIILVLLFATAALGLIAYNMNQPNPVAQVAQAAPAPVTVGYYVAAHPLPAGTLARDEDFAVRSAPSGGVPTGAILDTPDAKVGLRGSLVRAFLDAGDPVTSQDVLRPRDRGFLASVLAPGSRAVSINVDAESGVSGLIWPGDHVDVVLTHTINKDDLAHGTLSETVLHDVRIIAIDQEIVQGAKADNATAGKVTHTVSLQLAPEQVQRITVAEQLGKLSLAMRAAVEQRDKGESGTTFSGDVSPEIARQSKTVMVYAGDKVREYSVSGDKIKGYSVKVGSN